MDKKTVEDAGVIIKYLEGKPSLTTEEAFEYIQANFVILYHYVDFLMDAVIELKHGKKQDTAEQQ